MEEARIILSSRKPRLVLDKRFPFSRDMEIGEKGQLNANILIEGLSIYAEDGNDFLASKIKVVSASPVKAEGTRQ